MAEKRWQKATGGRSTNSKFAFVANTKLFTDPTLAVGTAIRYKSEFHKQNTNPGESPLITPLQSSENACKIG